MDSFSADWLALREAADLRARNSDLARRLARHVSGRESLRLLDLGAGSGNNMAAIAGLLAARQHWRLADGDAALLGHARRRAPAGTTVETCEVDLAAPAALESLFLPRPDVVTASAFFDLCGAGWIGRLADAALAARAVVYTVLNYDGRELWEPGSELDGLVLAAFHADQRRDKGLGPALGPEGHAALASALARRGYRVLEGRSDWMLEAPRDAELIAALAEGTAAATGAALGPVSEDWRTLRREARRAMIGHMDLLALPPA